MRTLAVIASLALATAVVAEPPGAADDRAEEAWLDAAREVAAWLDSVKVETEHGICWPVVPSDPEPRLERNLYAGSCGVVLFLLELHRATGEQVHLEAAKLGATDIAANMAAADGAADDGLWTGVAGRGHTLLEVARVTNDERFSQGMAHALTTLVRTARERRTTPRDGGPDRVTWNDSTDIISGTAGIGCFVLELGELQNLAEAAGWSLIDRAIEVESASGDRLLKWNMTDDFERLMPNFSHGTAGVGYFLAALAEELGPERGAPFLDAALAGGRYLVSITDEKTGLIMHHEPGGEDLFYLGWCHGPTGTARFYQKLGAVTGDRSWNDLVVKCAETLVDLELAKRRTPGFWNNVGQCCGSAGVASFLLSASVAYERPEWRDAADAITADILARSTVVDLAGARARSWTQAEHRVRPELLQAQTGYMQGAAGIGLWLLQRHAGEKGERLTIRFPDSPW